MMNHHINYSISTRKIKLILVVLLSLVISDGYITQFLVSEGLGLEKNPFLEPFVSEWYFLVVKTLGALFCALLLWDIFRKWPKLGIAAIPCFTVIYTVIVYWNLSIFFISLG
ncbi:DUF5658 family protein [Chloroflexota bacterium]